MSHLITSALHTVGYLLLALDHDHHFLHAFHGINLSNAPHWLLFGAAVLELVVGIVIVVHKLRKR